MAEPVALNSNLNDFDFLEEFVNYKVIDGFKSLDLNMMLETSWLSDAQKELWLKNYHLNKTKLMPFLLKEKAIGKIGILVGASPALQKNIKKLKTVTDDFIIISSNSALKLLLKEGIKPNYVFLVEAASHVAKDFDCDTKNLTLISSPFACPEALDKWEGDLYTYFLGSKGCEYDDLVHKEWDGVCDIDIGGGNVVSTSFLWAYKYLSLRHFIVIGMSLCYYDSYYAGDRKGNVDTEAYKGRYQAIDIYGKIVDTTPPLTMYKIWLEKYLKVALEFGGGGTFINSTEDGILGVYPEIVETTNDGFKYRPKYLPWISIIPLEVAIEGHKKRLEKKNEFRI